MRGRIGGRGGKVPPWRDGRETEQMHYGMRWWESQRQLCSSLISFAEAAGPSMYGFYYITSKEDKGMK